MPPLSPALELSYDIQLHEGNSARLIATLRDENGDAVAGSSLSTLTATLYRRLDGTRLNGRDNQSILNENGGAVYDTVQSLGTDPDTGDAITGNLLLALTASDLVAATSLEAETLILEIRATWGSSPVKALAHRYRIKLIPLASV